jgi:hypothetical protein
MRASRSSTPKRVMLLKVGVAFCAIAHPPKKLRQPEDIIEAAIDD